MIEIAYYFYYGNCITEAAVLSVYQTNPGEAKEYILQTLGYGGVLLTILTILACGLLFYRLNNKGFADINLEILGKNPWPFSASLALQEPYIPLVTPFLKQVS